MTTAGALSDAILRRILLLLLIRRGEGTEPFRPLNYHTLMETIFDEFNRPQRNYRTGQYLAGHKPFNAGVPWTEWMPEELRASVLSNLEKGRKRKGEPAPCAGWNARKVVFLDGSGIPHFYSSASAAGRMLRIQCRNIISCCQGKRKHAGGITFFYEDDPRWVEHYRLHGFDNQKNDL